MQLTPGAQETSGTPSTKDDKAGAVTGSRSRARLAPLATLPGQAGAPDSSSLARMALARARLRSAVPLDTVTFVAACPACGQDCEWTQEREETRVRSYQDCCCTPENPLPRTP